MVYHKAPFFLYTLLLSILSNVRPRLAGSLQHSNTCIGLCSGPVTRSSISHIQVESVTSGRCMRPRQHCSSPLWSTTFLSFGVSGGFSDANGRTHTDIPIPNLASLRFVPKKPSRSDSSSRPLHHRLHCYVCRDCRAPKA
jgi:hypothetical protein